MGNDRKNVISSGSGREGIYAKSKLCGTSRQSAQLWISRSTECRTTFSMNRKIPDTLPGMSRMCLECRRKNGEASLVGQTHRKAVQRSPKDKVEGLNLRPFMVPSWCGCSSYQWSPRFHGWIDYYSSCMLCHRAVKYQVKYFEIIN